MANTATIDTPPQPHEPTKDSQRPNTMNSFADTAPKALGKFNDEFETLASVELNGWRPLGLRTEPAYSRTGSPTGLLYREIRGFEDVKLRRRPLDGFTLQATRFHAFEDANLKYFPFPYAYPCKGGKASSCYDEVLRLAVEELGELDFLQPLASVMQTTRTGSASPLITRCWEFGAQPAALIKTAKMQRVDTGEFIDGTCICYQPPTWAELQENPNNYLTFRSVVAHEIGHQWWNRIRNDRPTPLRRIDDSDNDVLEQVVGLFSIFLILYRGYWHREPHSRDQLARAFDKLGFETSWGRQKRDQIIDDVAALKFPTRTFEAIGSPRLSDRAKPRRRLGETEVLAIREAAQEIAERARPIPFASAAAVLGQRKLDYFIDFDLGDTDDIPAWTIEELTAIHLESGVDVRSEWRHVQLKVPTPLPGAIELDLTKTLEVARQIAHLRLFGGRFGGGKASLQKSTDVERQCSDLDRDLARVLALALYAHDGKKSPRKMGPSVAKLLLHHDPSNLAYLDTDFDYYFQWCCVDSDCPEAEDRFLAEILEVGNDEVHFVMEGEDTLRFRGSLPKSSFQEAGFEDGELRPNMEFKLFGRDGELVPFRYR